MRVLLPLRKHANKQEDDEDDFLVLVDSDSEDGPQYIVHSLPEAAAALADPSNLASQGLTQARTNQASFESVQEDLLVQEIEEFLPGGKEGIGIVRVEKEVPKQDTFKLDHLNRPSVERLEFSQQHLQENNFLQEEIKQPLDLLDSAVVQGKSYKTTGLELEDSTGVSSNLVSRKRKAHAFWNEGATSIAASPASLLLETVSPLDQKPAARTVSNSPSLKASETKKESGSGNMVSGGPSKQSSEQWRYYYHARDELPQEVEEADESPEGVPVEIENNPESARGDDRFGPTIPMNNISIGAELKNIARYPPAATATATSSLVAGVSATGRTQVAGRLSATSPTSVDARFRDALKQRGLEIREQDGDGNCLFRAISLQIYGDPSMHGDIRKKCMDFMERDQEHFSQFVIDEPFPQYVARKRQDGVHGNNPEIQAVSELFNRPVEVFTPENGSTPLNIFHAEYKTEDAPIRLSYHDGNHYNAVVDPLVPTAGLGLGMPGLQPGLADKLQMAKAVMESDAVADQMELERAIKTSYDDEYHRAIKESKLSAEHASSNAAISLSDMDATYFELEQAALECSLVSYRQQEHGKKIRASTSNSKGGKESETVASGESNMAQSSIAREVASATELANHLCPLPCPLECCPSDISPHEVAFAAASVPVAASAASASLSSGRSDSPVRLRAVGEYPSTVQELVMNGFSLSAVVKAYDLVGNNFDDMLALLMANSSC